MIKPTSDYLLLLPDPKEKSGGVIIAGYDNFGIVANISDGETYFKIKQKVIFKPEKATDIYYRLLSYKLVKREDVMAVVIDD
ncbi:MAG: co-chaperone GroES [Bacilli bacterium]|nr:co-chaperone GroES [Bacilli bacterium]MDD4077775.1 hypothetical protein [Bacilli bacterium]MDD4389106.1 hypothetical protein [Bacilli bacterium]